MRWYRSCEIFPKIHNTFLEKEELITISFSFSPSFTMSVDYDSNNEFEANDPMHPNFSILRSVPILREWFRVLKYLYDANQHLQTKKVCIFILLFLSYYFSTFSSIFLKFILYYFVPSNLAQSIILNWYLRSWHLELLFWLEDIFVKLDIRPLYYVVFLGFQNCNFYGNLNCITRCLMALPNNWDSSQQVELGIGLAGSSINLQPLGFYSLCIFNQFNYDRNFVNIMGWWCF